MQNALYTTEHAKISKLLKQLQKQKVHIAVVLDEYGGTLGLVTLEDILEALGTTLADFFKESKDEQIVFKETDYFIDQLLYFLN